MRRFNAIGRFKNIGVAIRKPRDLQSCGNTHCAETRGQAHDGNGAEHVEWDGHAPSDVGIDFRAVDGERIGARAVLGPYAWQCGCRAKEKPTARQRVEIGGKQCRSLIARVENLDAGRL